MGFALPQGAALNSLNIVVSGATAMIAGSVPDLLAPIARYESATAVVSRVFALTRMNGMTGALHRINNLTYDGARIDFVARREELERWQVINRSMESHPMHVHGTQFQVMSA